MKLILQCVGSLPATPDLADEMNRVESAVDFIAGQEHDASEKCEILNIAAEAISVAGVSMSVSAPEPTPASVSVLVDVYVCMSVYACVWLETMCMCFRCRGSVKKSRIPSVFQQSVHVFTFFLLCAYFPFCLFSHS